LKNDRGVYAIAIENTQKIAEVYILWRKTGVFWEINFVESVTSKTNLIRQSNSFNMGDCNEAPHWHDD